MVTLMKKTPTDTDEIHEELNHHLALHHTDVAYIAVQTEFGAPYIIIYTIKTADDFDSAVYFIHTARRSGSLVAIYDRTNARHEMGTVAKRVLAHEPEHPYRKGLQWLVADAEDGMRYETADELFALSVDFYNLVVRGVTDRYRDVFGTAVADMQRKRPKPVIKLRMPDSETLRRFSELYRPAPEEAPVDDPDDDDDDDDEPVDEPVDTKTVGRGTFPSPEEAKAELIAEWRDLLMF